MGPAACAAQPMMPMGGAPMDSLEFKRLRKKLAKNQRQMAQLLAVSLKAVHSYEQGWRRVPPAVARQVYFLVARLEHAAERRPCWEVKECPAERKVNCPAWEFRCGEICWFVNGTIADGTARKNWDGKMLVCRDCKMFTNRAD
jgi:DNA-binding XRE family transcriptional regulator